MSGSDFGSDGDNGPGIEVVYPVGEETEVPQTNGNLFKTVQKEGHGPKPPVGAKVTVHYTGTLDSDGSKFDSSRDRDEPFEFTIGRGQVIKGWDKGVATMRKGERATLKCLSEFAYGKVGSPPKIPGDATLNFDVELIDWTKSEDVSENKDRTVMKGIRVEGTGWSHPGFESEVHISIKVVEVTEGGEDGAEILPEKDFTVTIGEVDPTEFPSTVEQALKSFKKGEISTVDVEASAVRESVDAFHVRSGQGFRAVVKVKDFTTVHTYDFQGEAKIDEANKRKTQGNTYFTQGKWLLAVNKYERALEFVDSDYGLDGESLEAAKKLRVPLYSNLAQALINLRRFKDAAAKCDKCLELEPANVKALFRRGRAKNALGDWEAAKPDLKRALEFDPSNADLQREWSSVVEQERKQRAADKARYGNLFSKLAAMEEKEQSKSE
jgi:FK506-binding protein 4/5